MPPSELDEMPPGVGLDVLVFVYGPCALLPVLAIGEPVDGFDELGGLSEPAIGLGDLATGLGERGKPSTGLVDIVAVFKRLEVLFPPAAEAEGIPFDVETTFPVPGPGPGSGEGLPAFGVKGQDLGP
jgi:hypothetical protein